MGCVLQNGNLALRGSEALHQLEIHRMKCIHHSPGAAKNVAIRRVGKLTLQLKLLAS